jgi:hypothetical protein
VEGFRVHGNETSGSIKYCVNFFKYLNNSWLLEKSRVQGYSKKGKTVPVTGREGP